MTEQEWLECTDPQPMLEFLQGKVSDRKLRLFAVACSRRIWPLLSDAVICEKTIAFAERFADGLASTSELHGGGWGKVGSVFSVVLWDAWEAAENAVSYGAGMVKRAVLGLDTEKYATWTSAFETACYDHSLGEAMRMADATLPTEYLAKGVQASSDEHNGQCHLLCDIFSNPFRPATFDPRWLTSTVIDLAKAIYEERAFDRMPILADALMDAGCDNDDIIAHCRGDGPHVRGCWVVDLLLGKS